jgi:hypothetical protein
VFEWQGDVCRALSAEAAANHRRLLELPFFTNAMDRGEIIETTSAPDLAPAALDAGFTAAVRHVRIPLVTWPWEWSFSMLRDAALLHLSLMQRALEAGWILCDASAFNIQFRAQQPVFIDTGSLVPLTPGAAWDGYRQFCQQFLYPLMLQAWKGVHFQPWLRGRIDGIPPEQFSRMLSCRDLLRRGALSHVWLHALLARRDSTGQPIRQSLTDAGFSKQMILHNVRKLRRVVDGLAWRFSRSAWTDYTSTAPHVPSDQPIKTAFVHAACSQLQPKLTWDIGCNIGTYSRIAAEFGEVAALDADHPTIDQLFRNLRTESSAPARRIVPLVYQAADPSPCLGWRGRERLSLEHRAQPQLVLVLAVLHHLVITNGLRLEDIIDWLRSLNATVILEWIDREDPMVKRLLQNREDVFSDFRFDVFSAAVNQHFRIARSVELPGRTRQLFLLEPVSSRVS